MNAPGFGLRKATKCLEKKERNVVVLTVIPTGIIPFFSMGIDLCSHSLHLTNAHEQSKRMEKSLYFSKGFLFHMGWLKHAPPLPIFFSFNQLIYVEFKQIIYTTRICTIKPSNQEVSGSPHRVSRVKALHGESFWDNYNSSLALFKQKCYLKK